MGNCARGDHCHAEYSIDFLAPSPAGRHVRASRWAAFPSIVRAQAKEIVVGGAANFAPWMNGTVAEAFEAKYKTKLVYEGTKSLVNLEKMQKNKDKQYLSVVMMDDPVMILAVQEGLLEKLTPASVPNLAKLRPAPSTWTACGPTTCSPGRASPTTPRRCRAACRPGPRPTIRSSRAG